MSKFKTYIIDPDRYFRVTDRGVYSRREADAWVEVTDKDVRDYYSRAIEGGDAFPLTPAEIAKDPNLT